MDAGLTCHAIAAGAIAMRMAFEHARHGICCAVALLPCPSAAMTDCGGYAVSAFRCRICHATDWTGCNFLDLYACAVVRWRMCYATSISRGANRTNRERRYFGRSCVSGRGARDDLAESPIVKGAGSPSGSSARFFWLSDSAAFRISSRRP